MVVVVVALGSCKGCLMSSDGWLEGYATGRIRGEDDDEEEEEDEDEEEVEKKKEEGGRKVTYREDLRVLASPGAVGNVDERQSWRGPLGRTPAT
ncbi:hypothetical protein M0804_000211 [Polistes exclamans]|nr:hypothetical protein M0804_000211 [Polistes exclamans]